MTRDTKAEPRRFEVEAREYFEKAISHNNRMPNGEPWPIDKSETMKAFIAGAELATPDYDRLKAAYDLLRDKTLKHREAYGLDIFPNSETLDETSTRDSISARMGRHMCDCFLTYIDEALAEARKILEGQ